MLESAAEEDVAPLRLITQEIARRQREGARPRVEIIGLDGPWQNLSVVRRLEATTGYNPLRIGIYDRFVSPGEVSALAESRRFPASFASYDCALARALGLEFLVLDRPIEQLRQTRRPARLETLLAGLVTADAENLLVGLDPADDAAVYRLDDERALVFTVDFFPPVVDDPYTWGVIAAVNAMSDVYAMGGEVKLALNIAAWPDDLDPNLLSEVFRGGADAAGEHERPFRRIFEAAVPGLVRQTVSGRSPPGGSAHGIPYRAAEPVAG